jgi:hypothetical protein
MAFEAPVLAYLDPGSGSMLVQLLLGGVAAAGVILKLTWHRLLSRLPGRGHRLR